MWPFVLIASLESLNYKHAKVLAAAKVREKPPDNAENRKYGVWREGILPSLAENAAEIRWTIFSDIYIPDDRNPRNQVLVLGLATSPATKKSFIWLNKFPLNRDNAFELANFFNTILPSQHRDEHHLSYNYNFYCGWATLRRFLTAFWTDSNQFLYISNHDSRGGTQ